MNRESQATENKSEEIARLEAIHEQQQQALIASHQPLRISNESIKRTIDE